MNKFQTLFIIKLFLVKLITLFYGVQSQSVIPVTTFPNLPLTTSK